MLLFNRQAARGRGPLSFETERGMSLHPTLEASTAHEPAGDTSMSGGRQGRAP
jgi:hypothetical protein